MSDRIALSLSQVDPEVAAAIDHETLRQHEGLEMIASENFVSEAVLEAAGSVFTNKYAEGYPGRRYYGGCEEVDKTEQLAIERACKLFNCSFANVRRSFLARSLRTCSRTRARRRMHRRMAR